MGKNGFGLEEAIEDLYFLSKAGKVWSLEYLNKALELYEEYVDKE